MKYDHQAVEKKWQEMWRERRLFAATEDPAKKKAYILDFFPYPSGAGLHVGHPLGYIATDIHARKKRMEGFNVLHPMGWDAFGLPAENYAIKSGVHPAESTRKNITTFRGQLSRLGLSYDWAREFATCDPEYYRWTQWLFLLLYKRGLAYKRKAPVNWCENDQTVLANEQVVDGCCDRCKNPVVQKELSQWFFRITDYADRLLEGLDRVDWPARISSMQRNWIGRSEGLEISFGGAVAAREFEIAVFTTRPDTLYGVSYLVLAPEHPLVAELVSDGQRDVVAKYVAEARKKSELQRTGLDQEKTGVPLGIDVVHPLTGKEIPVWVADYVVFGYGTGAVMGVPAHDDRDFAFARKYSLPVTQVIAPPPGSPSADPNEAAYTQPGIMVHSEAFDGLTSGDAKVKISDLIEAKNAGRRQVNYHLRDWLVSRQRYWGAPIPIIYCDVCGEVPVPEGQLPVMLPTDVDFRPTGESPLARSASFQDVNCPRCGTRARRESDTMDTFVDSSWYFLRYPSPAEDTTPFNQHAVAYWCPVDLYLGGAEHAVLHLLYARFFAKVIFDAGLIAFDEPFPKLRSQGLMLGEDGQKMSKSLGNVVNPDDVVVEHGADSLRTYEMFMGEFEETKPWSTQGLVGVRRFLDRAWNTVHDVVHQRRDQASPELVKALQKTVKKVTDDVEAFKFNTAVSAMMIFLNDWQRIGGGDHRVAGTFVALLSPFAPHLAEELWEVLGNKESISLSSWPVFDAAAAVDETVDLVVQVNGKIRDKMTVEAGLTDEDLKAKALQSEKVQAHLEGKHVDNIIVVRGRLVSIVVRG